MVAKVVGVDEDDDGSRNLPEDLGHSNPPSHGTVIETQSGGDFVCMRLLYEA
jgi:hypothetical protein